MQATNAQVRWSRYKFSMYMFHRRYTCQAVIYAEVRGHLDTRLTKCSPKSVVLHFSVKL